MRRGGWREHVRAELQAREGRLRGLRRLLERHEQGASPRSDALPSSPPPSEQQQEQQVALLAELLRSAEAESRQQRARLGCSARALAALERQHQEAESRAWTLGRENQELRAELSQSRALLREAQAGRLALEGRWLREKELEATRLNRAMEQEEKYRRKVSRLQEKLAKARGQAGQPDVESEGRGAAASAPPPRKKRPRWLEQEVSQQRRSPAPIWTPFSGETGPRLLLPLEGQKRLQVGVLRIWSRSDGKGRRGEGPHHRAGSFLRGATAKMGFSLPFGVCGPNASLLRRNRWN